jgi:hypothetical protein
MQKFVGLPIAEKIVKLKVSKACFLFLTRGLRLDPKGISFNWTAPLFKFFIYIVT